MRLLFFTITLLSGWNGTAANNPTRLPPYDVQVCERVFVAVARAHRDVLVHEGVNPSGKVAEIDPFEAAIKKLKADSAPLRMVSANSPDSLSSFNHSLNETLADLAAAPDRAATLEGFRERWGLSSSQLADILLPYREYDGRYGAVLREIISPEEAAGLATWAKYQSYLDRAPRLRERYEFYLDQITQLSLPEMAARLRPNDPEITEDQVRREIAALHLQIQARFRRPVPEAEAAALNQLLAARSAAPVVNADYEMALERAVDAGIPAEVAAQALGLGELACRFYLHFRAVERRRLPWSRWVVDDRGIGISEQDLLRRLYDQGLYHHEIARDLNLAVGRATNTQPVPSDETFRTVDAVTNKVGELRLGAAHELGANDLIDPIFGVVKQGGKFSMPAALDMIQAMRSKGSSYYEIAGRMDSSETGTRNFYTSHSPDFESGLPSPLKRLLSDTPTKKIERARRNERAPKRGVDDAFDIFHDRFREAAEDWVITLGPALSREIASIQKHLGLTQTDWDRDMPKLAKGNGGVARQDESRTTRPEKVTEIRNARYRFYRLLQNAIALHNEKFTEEPPLSPRMLESLEGIRLVIETLREEPIGQPFLRGKNPRFDAFSDNFIAASEDWPFMSDRLWERETEKIRDHLGIEEGAETEAFGLSKISTRMSTRFNEAQSQPRRIPTILAARYDVFRMLEKRIERYNKHFSDKPPLSLKQLESKDGIVAVLEAIRGEPLESYESGRNPAFDRFHDDFREGAKGWTIANENRWQEEVERIRVHLGMTRLESNKAFGRVLNVWGPEASRSDTNTDPDWVKLRRHGRLQIFRILKKAIAEHNVRYPEGPALEASQLGSPDGIAAVIKVLRSPRAEK